MKTMKPILMILALMLALSLGVTAFAEEEAAAPAAEPAAETSAASSALSDAQAEADALKEAFEAYYKAKAETRQESVLNALKEELDALVAAGKLTQEQADLILKYYAEQMATLQDGAGFGRNRNGGRGGNAFGSLPGSQGSGRNGNMPGFGNSQNGNLPGFGSSQNGNGNTPGFGNGMGGRHGRFNSQPTDGTASATPAAPNTNAPAGSAGT